MSAFFSSAETAFSSAKVVRLKVYVDQNRRGAKRALKIAEDYSHTIAAILVGNNIVNIAAASIATILFTKYFENYGAIISTVVMTILVLIFGEVIPKNYAKNNPEKFCLRISEVLYVIMRILRPLTYPIIILGKNIISFSDMEESPSMTEDELMTMIETIEEEGVIDYDERELIQSAIEFDDITVDEICTDRVDVQAIDIKHMNNSEITQMLLDLKHSRIPVYEDSIDNIVGILYEREFFGKLIEGKRPSVRRLMKEPLRVAGSMKISSLLEVLQRKKAHMAIVIDEHGGTEGIITLEDILEELVGEIWDEHDEVPELVVVEEDGSYIVDSEMDLEDFFEIHLNREDFPETDYSTVGGWAFEYFEKIPEINDSFEYTDLIVYAQKIENYKIEKVKVVVKQVGE